MLRILERLLEALANVLERLLDALSHFTFRLVFPFFGLAAIFTGMLAGIDPIFFNGPLGPPLFTGLALTGILSLALALQGGNRNEQVAVFTVILFGLLCFGFYRYLSTQPLVSFGGTPATAIQLAAVPTEHAASTAPPEVTHVATGPDATIAVTGSCGQALVSDVQELNLRSAPSLGSPKIQAFPKGTIVELLCNPPQQVDDVLWRHVRIGELEGWMSGRYLK